MATINIIAAMSRNRVIGLQEKIPWHLPEDLKRFKALTADNPIVMGRKTYQSIGCFLPFRLNIVITRNEDFNPIGIVTASSLKKALFIADYWTDDEIFIIGGGEIFRQTLDIAQKIYLTIIDKDFPGDVFFPKLDPKKWHGTSCEAKFDEKNKLHYCFLNLEN